jgi:hypothetical protein
VGRSIGGKAPAPGAPGPSPDPSEVLGPSRSSEDAPSGRARGLREVVVVALVFVVVNLSAAAFQDPLSFEENVGWDGFFYRRMAIQLSGGDLPRVDAPFVYRIGTPWLAALVPGDDVLTGFRVVNLLANVLAVVLLMLFLRSYIESWRVRALLLVLYMANWLAPTRFLYFMPIYTDPWDMVFVFAGFLAVARAKDLTRRALVLAIITFVGVWFREDVLLLPLALLFGWFASPFVSPDRHGERRPSLRLPPTALWLPLAAGGVAYAGTHLLATPTNDYTYADAAAFWAFQKPLLGLLLAWFITFGPILGLALFDWRHAVLFLRRNGFFLGYLLGAAAFAWIGGATTERFLLWSTPIALLLVGRAIERHARLLRSSLVVVGALVVAQVLAYRLFWVVPDWPSTAASPVPVFQLLTNHAQYEDLWSWSLSTRIRSAYVLEYAAFVIGTVAWLRYRSRELRPS